MDLPCAFQSTTCDPTSLVAIDSWGRFGPRIPAEVGPRIPDIPPSVHLMRWLVRTVRTSGLVRVGGPTPAACKSRTRSPPAGAVYHSKFHVSASEP